ncbi:MAG: hypothetical protein H6751_00050 [Candidatus Omnitrophica bacterium]|nr:hypothetical protein [Candidatus Omnitrophota bacterium]
MVIRSLSVALVFAVVFGILFPKAGIAESTRSEDFAKDPHWDAVNNRIDPKNAKTVVQDFGYSKTNHAGGESPGEIGGRITRSLTKASYAKKIEEKTLEDKLSASGQFAVPAAEGGSAMLFGWFNSDSDGWRTPNSLAFRLDGNGGKYWVFFEYGTQAYGTGGGDTFEGERYQTTSTPPTPSGDKVHHWELSYDPEGADGHGEMTFTFDGETFTAPLLEGHKDQGAVFNRFGILNQMTTGSDMEVYFDDITLDGEKFTFDQDPKWEGVGNHVEFQDKIVRPFHDFGYSETDHAGGEPGEMGGVVWRIEDSHPENAAYYGDNVGKLTLDDRLEASGRVSMLKAGADSAGMIGWFNSKTFREGSIPRNFLGVQIEGPSRVGHYFRPAYMNDQLVGENPGQGPLIRPDGKQYEWKLVYDPEANNGLGEITVQLNGEKVSLPLRPGAREGGAEFDRFGMVTFLRGGHHVEIYFDDLTYTVGP